MDINMDLYHALRKLNIDEKEATKAASMENHDKIIRIEKGLFYHRFAFGFIIGLQFLILGKVW